MMILPVGDTNPTRRLPVITVALITTNVAVFLLFNLQLAEPRLTCFIFRWAAIPLELVSSRPLPPAAVRGPACLPQAIAARNELLSVFTSMFLHAGLLHLGLNMLFLWVFGNNVEDRLGHLHFLLFYLAGGVVSVYAFAFLNEEVTAPLIGASGAIAAVLGGYILMFPRARVHTYVPFPLYLLVALIPGARVVGWFLLFAIVHLPAWLVLGLWFVTEALAVQEPARTGVANEAHVAGFLAGIVFTLLLGGRHRGRQPEPHPAVWG